MDDTLKEILFVRDGETWFSEKDFNTICDAYDKFKTTVEEIGKKYPNYQKWLKNPNEFIPNED